MPEQRVGRTVTTDEATRLLAALTNTTVPNARGAVAHAAAGLAARRRTPASSSHKASAPSYATAPVSPTRRPSKPADPDPESHAHT